MVQPIRPQDATGVYQRQLLGAEQASGLARREGAGGQGHARRLDQVSLSADARSFARIMQSVAEQPDVRAERVQEIQDRIAAGRYSVDADALARAIVEWGFRA
jgi:flagellar biosynthesis anti-sigma factor FlgM